VVWKVKRVRGRVRVEAATPTKALQGALLVEFEASKALDASTAARKSSVSGTVLLKF
jgi:hypothetical protein